MGQVNRTVAGAAAATTITAPMTAGSPASGGGTFGIANGSGYPTANFVVVIDRGLSTEEKIFCSSRSANVLTVGTSGRGFDGTAAASHSNGATLEHELDAAVITALLEHVNTNAGDDHASTYLNTARHDVTARHTFGAALGTPAAGADIATAGAAGSGASPARSDHVHKIGAGAINSAAMFAAGVVAAAALDAAVYGGAPANVGTSPSAGAATTLSRSDHVHDLGNGSINDPTLFTAGVVDLAAMGTNSVGTSELVDGTVTAAKIANEVWDTYTPAITADSGSPIIGNGVLSGRYRKQGRTVLVEVSLQLGTTTNFGGGNVYLSLPFTMRTPSPTRQCIGVADLYDSSASTAYAGTVIPVSTWGKTLFYASGSVNPVSGAGAVPFAWATGDVLSFSARFETAS